MKYVTKLGAYGLAVATAFAVALAVLVSVSSTSTIEAATTADPDPAQPGATVDVETDLPEDDDYVRFTITSESTASASFVSGGGRTLLCRDRATTTTCDKDATGANITVKVKIDADSPDGIVVVSAEDINNDETETVVFEVSSADVVTSLTAKASPGAAPADGTDTSAITVTAKNSKGVGVDGIDVRVVTTGGTLASEQAKSDTSCEASDSTQSCTLTTLADDAGTTDVNEAGTAIVTLTGADRPGDAVLTFTLGDLTATATVTLFGEANKITVEAEQGSAEIGGSTNLVVTVTDSAGNPVASKKFAQTDVKVTASTSAAQGVLAQVGYAKDVAGTANDLPSCGEDLATTAEDGGTNSKGKCVIKVFAGKKDVDPDGAPDADVAGSNPLEAQATDAARGPHSIEVTLNSTTKATASVNVSGAPASIAHDAPESVEPLSETKITVTVTDDEGIAAGATKVKVTKVDGGGILEGLGTDRTNTTVDGVTSFTLFAGGSEGSVTIVVDANPGSKQVREVVTISVASAMPEEPVMPPEPDEPAMPEGEATLTFLSPSIASFSGGSVADLAAAAEAECPGGATFWVQADDGSWPAPYSTTATLAIANSPFEAEWAGGFGMTAVFFTECETDAMEDQS